MSYEIDLMHIAEDELKEAEQELERERLAKLQEEWVRPSKIPEAKVVSGAVFSTKRITSYLSYILDEYLMFIASVGLLLLLSGVVYALVHMYNTDMDIRKKETSNNYTLGKSYLNKYFPNEPHILQCSDIHCNIKFRTIPEKTIKCTNSDGCWEVNP